MGAPQLGLSGSLQEAEQSTEVQHFLGFINIKTDLVLCLVDQQAKLKTVYMKHAADKHPP